jgi:nucleotide sugar dehydrogenase
MRVAIIGLGIIGRAQVRMFTNAGAEVVGYDPAHHATYPFAQIAECDFAVICVGTPQGEDGHADLKGVFDAMGALPEKLPVIIRSTVPPGTTDILLYGRGHQEHDEFFPADCRYSASAQCVVHVPEFMYEREGGPWSESTDVPYMLLGGSQEAQDFFAMSLAEVFPGKIHRCTALEAELAKYTINLYWATKVTFVNQMAAIARHYGADWERVAEAWLMDPRVNESYTRMEGFPPGFGGRCWPKDIAALVAQCGMDGLPVPFLKQVQFCNEFFLAQRQ